MRRCIGRKKLGEIESYWPPLTTPRDISRTTNLAKSHLGCEPAILFQTVKVATPAFWDAYLRDTDSAGNYLNSSALVDFSGNKAEYENP